MTVTSNIFVGISAWTPSTGYAVGNRRSNGGNAYQCTQTGTSASSGGPSGTGSSITDGSVIWKFLAAVNYVTIASWASGIPGALTQPIVGLLWDCGPITTTAGVGYLTLSGHTTSSTNTITLKAAPGESIRDIIAANSALAFNSSAGVRFVLPSSVGNTNYITISDANVIFQGLQFQDPFSTSNSSIIATRSPGDLTLNSCVFDGYSQTGGACIFDFEAPAFCENCLIVDRQASGTDSVTANVYSSAANSKFVNCTFIATNGPISTGGAVESAVSGVYVRNSVFTGYNTPNFGSSVNIAFDHSATNASSFGSFTTDNGGNLFSITPSSQFIDTATDFRLKVGSGLIGKGISDIADIPTGDDIAGRTRAGWDIGAWAYFVAAQSGTGIGPWSSGFSSGFGQGSILSIFALRASGVAALSSVNNATGRLSFGILQASGSAAQRDQIAGLARILFLTSNSTATQNNGSSASGSPWSSGFSTGFGPIATAITVNILAFIPSVAPIGTAILTQPTSASGSLLSISSNSLASVSNATAQINIFPVSASGVVSQLGATANLMTLSCVAAATPLLLFSGLANIDWQVIVAPLTSATNANAVVSFFAINSSATITQAGQAAGTATVLGLSSSAAIGSSCSAIVSAMAVSLVATSDQFDLASGIATIEVIAIQKAIPPLLESDAAVPLALVADGSGLLLAADVNPPNMTSQTSASSTSTIPTLSCAASSLLQTFWSGSVSVEAVSATAQLQQIDRMSGTAVIPSISAVGSAVQRGAASGTGTIERLVASGSLGQRDAASGLATIPALTVAGSGQGVTQASAAARLFAMAASSTAAVGSPVTASGSLMSMRASGSMAFALAASGAATVAFSAAGQMGQVNSCHATASISVGASGTAAVGILVSGSARVPSIAAIGSAAMSDAAVGRLTLPSLSASGNAVNTVNLAQGAASLMALASSATMDVHGASVAGSASITFSARGVIMSAIEASVLVELEQIVASHAQLWTTPIGYERGETVVWWPD